MFGEQGIDAVTEALQLFRAVPRPITREEVVVEHVDHDSGKPPPPGADSRAASPHYGVRIGESVDPAVEHDAPGNRFRVPPAERTLDEIAHEAAQQAEWLRVGQVEVGEKVHRGRLVE